MRSGELPRLTPGDYFEAERYIRVFASEQGGRKGAKSGRATVSAARNVPWVLCLPLAAAHRECISAPPRELSGELFSAVSFTALSGVEKMPPPRQREAFDEAGTLPGLWPRNQSGSKHM